MVTVEGGRLYLPLSHSPVADLDVVNHLKSLKIQVVIEEPRFEEKSLVVKDSVNFFIFEQIKDKKFIEWEGIGLQRAIKTSKEI